ncbi:unnamed protein product [Spirodela intermedia]|uniref:Uncharacterized protein n=2 Tax=Spirodela intermedia TaxID=51605 RepID=A0A7I8IT55_SPIIN|nr:unnamed protein product [Spirodela intermedia]CAA6660985.1 unnamed protein product [Spirodela intermedia]CAA7397347.1 unnamed protein product [Spirodela intermedia]
MASRLRSVSKPAFSLLQSTMRKRSSIPLPNLHPRGSPSFSRLAPLSLVPREICSLQSLLPFHSAVSAALLTSRLGTDSAGGSRSMSKGTLCSSNPGV